MFIYNGKFNWPDYASNETITIIFPAGFSLNDPVSAFWQWSVDPVINEKARASSSGVIQGVTTTGDDYTRIGFSSGFYSYEATVTSDYKTLSVAMLAWNGTTSGPFNLTARHINPTSIPSIVVYTGRLDWLSYATNEMVTLVVPYGVADGAFFGLYHQWTVNANGVEKANMPVDGVFQDIKYGADGTITAVYKAEYYTYEFTFRGKEGSFVLSNPNGNRSENKFAVTYTR